MESSAKGILQVPNWIKLKRDKGNYVPWQRAVMEVLEAVGCEAAITEDFAKLRFNDEDYDSKTPTISSASQDSPVRCQGSRLHLSEPSSLLQLHLCKQSKSKQ